MTEIEKTEGEIKVLQAKLELLKEMENHKSPAEEAYRGVYGWYPPTTPNMSNYYENNRWSAFQNGYKSAKEDYKVEEEPEQATLYDVVRHGLEYSIGMCNAVVNAVEEWLPNELEQDEDLNGYRAGWNDCINTLNKQLR